VIEPFTIQSCETRKGTKYTVNEWKCPICNKEKSTLFIDDEWCHGDSEASYHFGSEHKKGCIDCIIAVSNKP